MLQVHEGMRQLATQFQQSKAVQSMQLRIILQKLIARGLLAPESANYISSMPPQTPISDRLHAGGGGDLLGGNHPGGISAAVSAAFGANAPHNPADVHHHHHHHHQMQMGMDGLGGGLGGGGGGLGHMSQGGMPSALGPGSHSTDLAALGTLPLHALAAGGGLHYSSRNASLQSDSLQAQLDALEAGLLAPMGPAPMGPHGGGGEGGGGDSTSSHGSGGMTGPMTGHASDASGLGGGGGGGANGGTSPIDSANGGRNSSDGGDGHAGGSGNGSQASGDSQVGCGGMTFTRVSSDLHGDEALNLFSSSLNDGGDGVSPAQSNEGDGAGGDSPLTGNSPPTGAAAAAGPGDARAGVGEEGGGHRPGGSRYDARLPPYPVRGSRSYAGSQSGSSNDDTAMAQAVGDSCADVSCAMGKSGACAYTTADGGDARSHKSAKLDTEPAATATGASPPGFQ